MAVVHGFDEFAEQAVEFVEIHDDAHGVKFGCRDGDLHLPIVAMEGFEGAVVETKLMTGGEMGGGGDLEVHGLAA